MTKLILRMGAQIERLAQTESVKSYLARAGQDHTIPSDEEGQDEDFS